MKRSEVFSRVRAKLPCSPHFADNVLAIAEALGIEVEPDEPELPERLTGGWTENGMVYPPGAMFCTGEGFVVAVSKPGDTFGEKPCVRLANALIDAYNNRPRWRTGAPPGDGTYLVSGPEEVACLYRMRSRWFRPYTNTAVPWADGRPWMPLPE